MQQNIMLLTNPMFLMKKENIKLKTSYNGGCKQGNEIKTSNNDDKKS